MSFEIALSGINAVNNQLGSISNNIANSGTNGFKSGRSNFSSAYAGSQALGVETSSATQNIGKAGGLFTTGRLLDAAIQGTGFFVTKESTGSMSYTRVGIFDKDKDGFLVDSFGRRAQGYAPSANGTAAMGAIGDIKVPVGQVPAKATDRLQFTGNLSADWPAPATAVFNKDDATSFNASMVSTVYDSLGTKHNLTQYFVKDGAGVTAHYSFDGTVLPANTALSFDAQGKLSSPNAPVALALGTPGNAAPLSINLDYAGTSRFAGEVSNSVNSANGYASGSLTGVMIEENGEVMAKYSNGQKQSAGTLVLANFPNEGALQQVSSTSWAETSGTGTPLYSAPGTGTSGKLTAGALEQSNVDMTGELVSLMTAQRNYQANTKVISTENQVIQALMQAL
ncbi:MAG: flagellar hook-basal body complex protein [Iodobacter sp.]